MVEVLLTMMKTLFEKALHIEDPYYVKEINFDETNKVLEIQVDFEKGAIFQYTNGAEGINGKYKAYDTEEKRWRHLNFFEHECYLICRTPRVKTEKGTKLVDPPWAGESLGFTMLFEALIMQLCSNMPVNTVSKIVKESDDKIWRVIEKYVNETLAMADLSAVKIIGMDETSKKKGHDYITLFVDLAQKKTIHIAEGKGHETVASFVEELAKHGATASQISDVSCDMSPAFIKGVKKSLPNAKITFDKFHILKIINEAVDAVRKEEVKNNPMLTGMRYIFLKNTKNLTVKQTQQLNTLKLSKINIKSLKALQIRENFQEIYKADDINSFELLLKKWYFWATHSRLEPIKQAAYTIKRHWDGVVNWKCSNISNGILEGLNSLIQAAKAKARGFRSFRCFRLIAFLITGKLNFKIVNPSYCPL